MRKKRGGTFPSFFYTFILYKLAQGPPASNQGRWKLVITKVRFWGYSIEWQLGGLGQVLDARWMEPVWAAHYRRTSAAVRPPDSASSFTLTLGCRVNACERPEAEQNHTHTHTRLHNRRRHVLLLTFTPATDSGCQLENESINLKRKKKKRFMAAAFGHRNVRRNAWCYLCVDALLRYTHNR